MARIGLLILFMAVTTTMAMAQHGDLALVEYAQSLENFPNPERGFFSYTETFPGFAPLDATTLRQHRAQNRTMIWRLYTIRAFRETDITQAFLDQMTADFQAMREAGVKCILRFRYSTSIGEADAPLSRVLSHIQQLRPVLQANYDVIAVANAGFIGAWGEWHSSTNNLTTISNSRSILFAMIDAVPERSVQVRYPKAKWDIFGNARAVTKAEAFNGSYKSRTGHLNDCFLASNDDVGTYRVSVFEEKKYLNEDVKYTSMTGETCDPQSGWTNYGCDRAMTELVQMRWSMLNTNYSRIILNRWVTEGCMPDVERRLGYRIALLNGAYSQSVAPGSGFTFQADVTNLGFAAPLNRRGHELLLRNTADDTQIWKVNLPEDVRYWLGGDIIQLRHTIRIPADMPAGTYELLLHYPDPMPKLNGNPEFSIRLANTNVWEPATGFNRLNHQVVVSTTAPATPVVGTLAFAPYGTSTSIDRSSSNRVQAPSTVELLGNYPNPFNPVTHIGYRNSATQHIRLSVHDLLGREVAVLQDGVMPAGEFQTTFDASMLSSGIYLYQIRTTTETITKTMVLLK